ncbi:glycosyltransferase [Chloroflexota bacterium]
MNLDVGKESKKRKVLMVPFLFPPSSIVGAVRPGKFAKYLTRFGWKPIVLTPERVGGLPQVSPIEMSSEADIVRIPYFSLGNFIREKLIGSGDRTGQENGGGGLPGGNAFYRTLHRINPIYSRSTLFELLIDNADWYFRTVRRGMQVVTEQKIDIIFSSYPPSVSHLVAASLHRKTGIPWVAELRDLWSSDPYPDMRIIQPLQFLEEQIEKRVLKSATSLITSTSQCAQWLEALHSKKVEEIQNGFDEEDYVEDVSSTSKFILTYTGNIGLVRRNSLFLFLEALYKLRREEDISPDEFEVRFFGGDSLASLTPSIERYNLKEIVKIYDFIPFKESLRRQRESTVLLLPSWNDPRDKGTLTGKIHQYLGAQKPIIAISFRGGAIDELLTETGTGVVVNTVDEIKGLLSLWLKEFRQSRNISSHYRPNSNIYHYTWREQTQRLVRLFEQKASIG